jgi:two-component system sensor histidine kinase VanS
VSAVVGTRERRLLTWRPRMTIRARLTLTYATLLTVAGAIMLTIVYVFMRYVPTYAIASTAAVRSGPTGDVVAGGPATPLDDAGPTVQYTDAVLELTSASDILNTLLLISVIVLVVLAVAGSIVGWVVAGRVLRPLQSINHAAQLASTGALDHRVGLSGPHDEVRDLSDTFDEMLDTLERSFHAQKRFTANASHELRTPIATIQTLLDVALADPDFSAEEFRTTALRVRDTNARNAQTVEALLDLAEIGSGRNSHGAVDLAEIAEDALDIESGLAERRRLAITTTLEPAEAIGDPVLMRQAVQNLVQNAVRHNVDGGVIRVSARSTTDARAELVIVNTGEVVSTELARSLTEPFVRARGRIGRRGAHDGAGLGLAVTTSIVDAHHGTLTLTPNDGGGLTIVLSLPGAHAR